MQPHTNQQQYRTIIKEISWPVKSSDGTKTYTVSAAGFDAELRCTCPARGMCRHMKAVARGDVERPRVRVTCKPVTPVRRVQVSEAMRDHLSQLDV